jgi:hypothetical protein
MNTAAISEFVDNHFEVTINERVKITFANGESIYGFFKRHPESESKPFEKLKEKNQWEFFIIPPEDTQPQKPKIINGNEVVAIEITEISA